MHSITNYMMQFSLCTFFILFIFFCLNSLKGFKGYFKRLAASAKNIKAAISQQICVLDENHAAAFLCITIIFLHKKVYLNDSLDFLYLLFNTGYH